MFRILFALVITLHGLIHLMGFFRAFRKPGPDNLNTYISKPVGMLWLTVTVLFVISAVFILLKINAWIIIIPIAVLTSQILIILNWGDARYGTIGNMIILLIAVPLITGVRFDRKVDREVQEMFTIQSINPGMTKKQLPDIVRKWIASSGFEGARRIQFVRLKQKGELKLKPGGNWMPFEATQYFRTGDPAFVWKAKVSLIPPFNLTGRDKFINGTGEMNFKFLSLVNVVNEANNEKINSGAMVRYLAEICWFPIAALDSQIRWESIDSLTAIATMTYGGMTVSGSFTFNESGDLIAFESERYYGGGGDSKMEKWRVENISFKNFAGYRLPDKSRVIWKLSDGDFNWLNLEVTDIGFNKKELY